MARYLVYASDQPAVRALNPPDGTLLWSNTDASGSVRSSPLVADGNVYFADTAGTVFSVSVSDGSTNWSNTLSERVDGAIAIGKNKLFLITNSSAYGLNRSDGSVNWSESVTGGTQKSSPVISEDESVIYFADQQSGEATALSVSDGSVEWSKSLTGGSIDLSPQIYEGSVIFGTSNGVFSLDATDGTEEWSNADTASSSLLADEGSVYYGAGTNLKSVDSSTGSEEWSTDFDFDITGGPQISQNILVVGQTDNGSSVEGSVFGVDISDGNTLWEYTTGYPIETTPTIFDSDVYVSSAPVSRAGEDVASLNIFDGSKNWSKNNGTAAVGGSPTVASKNVSSGSRARYNVESNQRVKTAFAPYGDQKLKGVVGTVYLVVTYNGTASSDNGRASVEIRNIDKDNIMYSTIGQDFSEYEIGESRVYIVSETAPEGNDLSLDSLEVELNVLQSSDDGSFRLSYGCTLKSTHRHDIEPGIIEEFGGSKTYPQNCRISINGRNILTEPFGDGSGRFDISRDVRGEMDKGQVNVITISSDSTGNMLAFVEGDLYRQPQGQG